MPRSASPRELPHTQLAQFPGDEEDTHSDASPRSWDMPIDMVRSEKASEMLSYYIVYWILNIVL